MQLSLNDDEASDLGELLTQALGDLSAEIANTDNASYRRELRARQERLTQIRQQLTAGAPPLGRDGAHE